MDWKHLRRLSVDTYHWWSEHNAPRLGAALAYYSLLSMAPLMILVVAICGLVFRRSAEQDVLREVGEYVGEGGANTIRMLLENAHRPAAGVFASFVAVLTLFFGASGVFLELRSSLNLIWDVPAAKDGGIRGFAKDRLGSFLMVLALGLLLLASLLVSAVIAIGERFATGYLPISSAIVGEIVNTVTSIGLLTALFGLVYKFVPQTRVEWRDVGVGALVTAVLFTVGKALLAVYLSTAAVGSTYGAAGSIVALVVWVYYSAQIFFMGAVFTRLFAERYGSHRARPEPTSRAKAQSA